MECRMDGRVALITGGSRGLGRAMASRFAAAGGRVAIVARRPDVLEETRAEIAAASGQHIGAYAYDVSASAAPEAAFAAVIADFGRVDILVNNAGASRTGPFETITDAVWQEDLDLKLFAAIRLIRLALPGMRERRWGRIINILNTGAKAPRPGGAPTVVSRAAGMALTKALAGEVAPHNILVNALCTGKIHSDQVIKRHQRNAPDQSFEDYVATVEAEDIPLGRMGTAEEYANMACFLASDAGSFIAGTAINVDGGLCPVV